MEIAAQLVRVKVDVIVIGTDLAIGAVKRQTTAIPIVTDEILRQVTARIAFKLHLGCERR
jgi:hypothetical protein